MFELLLFLNKYGIDGNTFVLYHGCIDPWSNYNQKVHKIAPLGITLLFSYNLICICSNIYLYKFLSQQTESNTATKEVDKKKDRRRNLIPATTGFLFAISFWEAIKMLRFAFLYDSKRTSYSRALLLKLLA